MGDCDHSLTVTINEVVIMVDIALETSDVSACTVGDQNRDGAISIDEILTAVNNALHGCP